MPSNEEIYITLQAVLTQQAKMEEQIKGALKRIDEQKQLAESVQTLAFTVRDLANEQKSTGKAVSSLRADVDEIKERPAKRWDGATTVAITAFVTAVITYILSRIGLK